MLNSDPVTSDKTGEDAAVEAVLRSGAKGAIALAGLSTAVVIAVWFAFYFFVFMPRAGAP